jgi:hypothetical protein
VYSRQVKSLPSSEFRRVYPSLDEPTEVTALGRLIGTWFPVGFTGRLTDVAGQPQGHGVVVPAAWKPLTEETKARFNNTPFTGPIPKSGRKK